MPRVPSTLDSHVGYWMRFVSNHVSHAFSARVQSHGVTVAEWVVLRTLYGAEPLYPSQVAELLGMTRGTISKLVDRLSAKGLVTRAADAERGDRRFHTVALSTSGEGLVPTLAALADQNDRDFFGHLESRERAKLIALLQQIVHRRGLRGAPIE